MGTLLTRLYNWVTDKGAAVPITASRMDGEQDAIVAKINQKVLIKSTAPTSPIAGMFWLDSTNKLLKEYRNSEWVVHGAVHIDTSAPTTPQKGDLWMDTTTFASGACLLKAFGDVWQNILSTSSVGTEGQLLASRGLGTNPQWLTLYGSTPTKHQLLTLDTNSKFPKSVLPIEFGSVGLGFSAQAFVTAQITFTTPFKSAPFVFGNVARHDNSLVCVGIFVADSINTAGFFLSLYEYQQTAVTGTEIVHWKATGDY